MTGCKLDLVRHGIKGALHSIPKALYSILEHIGLMSLLFALEKRGVDLGGKAAVEEAARKLVSGIGRDRCVVGDCEKSYLLGCRADQGAHRCECLGYDASYSQLSWPLPRFASLPL
jgi:hypothetical protein